MCHFQRICSIFNYFQLTGQVEPKYNIIPGEIRGIHTTRVYTPYRGLPIIQSFPLLSSLHRTGIFPLKKWSSMRLDTFQDMYDYMHSEEDWGCRWRAGLLLSYIMLKLYCLAFGILSILCMLTQISWFLIIPCPTIQNLKATTVKIELYPFL